MNYEYVIVGAGFAGAVIAERIANVLNKKVLVLESRGHIGGNVFDELKNGILIHRYGPHIFHTNSRTVFEYLSRFTDWIFYEHKVVAKSGDEYYPIPVNRITVNKLFGRNFKTCYEVKKFYESIREKQKEIKNSEHKIVDQAGYYIYEKFYREYTKKQWGIYADQLTPQICGRVPLRTNDDCRYFTDKYQFMPKNGYTAMFNKMLSNSNIEVQLIAEYEKKLHSMSNFKLIYTGPIDGFFDYDLGRLQYRSVDFKFVMKNVESYQEAPVINYVDASPKYTRITEYKKITGQVNKKVTVISREYGNYKGDPYYPVINSRNIKMYMKYKKLAEKMNDVFFVGRLAEFKYYNMDQVVARSLMFFNKVILK